MPYFLSAAIMINLGGTSTLIGSVSNMIIGIQAGLGFNDFIVYLTPAEILLWLLTILALYYFFRSRLGEEKTPPVYDPMGGCRGQETVLEINRDNGALPFSLHRLRLGGCWA